MHDQKTLDQFDKLIAYVELHNARELINVRREPNPNYPLRLYLFAEFSTADGYSTGGCYVNPALLSDESVWYCLVERLQAAVDTRRDMVARDLQKDPSGTTTVH